MWVGAASLPHRAGCAQHHVRSTIAVWGPAGGRGGNLTILRACTTLRTTQIVGECDMVYGVAHSNRISRVYAIQRADALQFVQVCVFAVMPVGALGPSDWNLR